MHGRVSPRTEIGVELLAISMWANRSEVSKRNPGRGRQCCRDEK